MASPTMTTAVVFELMGAVTRSYGPLGSRHRLQLPESWWGELWKHIRDHERFPSMAADRTSTRSRSPTAVVTTVDLQTTTGRVTIETYPAVEEFGLLSEASGVATPVAELHRTPNGYFVRPCPFGRFAGEAPLWLSEGFEAPPTPERDPLAQVAERLRRRRLGSAAREE